MELHSRLLGPPVTTWLFMAVNFSSAVLTRSNLIKGIEKYGDRQAFANGESSTEVANLRTS